MEPYRKTFKAILCINDFKTLNSNRWVDWYMGYDFVNYEIKRNEVELNYIESIPFYYMRIWNDYNRFIKNCHIKIRGKFIHELKMAVVRRERRLEIKQQKREKNERRRLINQQKREKQKDGAVY